ncbi:MAG: hypothetical protein G01um101491_129 [Parcubacteria group bacterium Gr01-1014_91]|nr:MAG: hypothetical protein G01um101491_129 [Parcubacteria group bacterium Gr01-1014_91]
MLSLEELRELAKTDAFRAEMKDVFFEAMNNGYANSPKKKSVLWLPGSKTIEYIRDPWRVVDTYHVTQLSTRSGGTTITSYEETPVWIMQYLGEYNEVVIPCLKAALRAAYGDKQFFGGRGPEFFQYGKYSYRNFSPRNVWHNHRFGDRFNGNEEINDEDGQLKGWHSYQGCGML